MDSPRAAAVKQLFTQRKCERHGLFGHFLAGIDILVVHIRRASALDNIFLKGLEVARLECGCLLLDARVVAIEMHGAKHCSVAAGRADIGYVLHELVLINLAQDTLAEIFGDALHLLAHGGILIRKVGMASAGVYDAKGISAGGEIKIELLDNGIAGSAKSISTNEPTELVIWSSRPQGLPKNLFSAA